MKSEEREKAPSSRTSGSTWGRPAATEVLARGVRVGDPAVVDARHAPAGRRPDRLARDRQPDRRLRGAGGAAGCSRERRRRAARGGGGGHHAGGDRLPRGRRAHERLLARPAGRPGGGRHLRQRRARRSRRSRRASTGWAAGRCSAAARRSTRWSSSASRRPRRRRGSRTRIQAAPRSTSTDADAIHLSRSGVATGVISVPNRYMHSPNEIVSLADLDATIRCGSSPRSARASEAGRRLRPPVRPACSPSTRSRSRAPVEACFRAGADVERWPEILPHYRWVRFQRRDGFGTGRVEMAARRRLRPPALPRLVGLGDVARRGRARRSSTATWTGSPPGWTWSGASSRWPPDAPGCGSCTTGTRDPAGRSPAGARRTVADRVIGPVFIHHVAQPDPAGHPATRRRGRRTGPRP